MLLSDASMIYESDKRLEGYSPYTLRNYLLQSKLLIRGIGDIDIGHITHEQLKGYLSNDAQRLKASSLGHRIRFIKSFFNWALNEGYIGRNPTTKIREPKQEARVPKALTEEQIEILRESCKTSREHALLEFLFATGCRVGEVVKLNRSNIDWNNRSVIVYGKGSKERECYFGTRCSIWLTRYLRERIDDDEALFVTQNNPRRRLSIEQIRWILKRMERRANLNVSVHPHKFRHSYATHLLNNGAPIEVVQSLMGHSKTQTTLLYISLSGMRRQEQYRRYF